MAMVMTRMRLDCTGRKTIESRRLQRQLMPTHRAISRNGSQGMMMPLRRFGPCLPVIDALRMTRMVTYPRLPEYQMPSLGANTNPRPTKSHRRPPAVHRATIGRSSRRPWGGGMPTTRR